MTRADINNTREDVAEATDELTTHGEIYIKQTTSGAATLLCLIRLMAFTGRGHTGEKVSQNSLSLSISRNMHDFCVSVNCQVEELFGNK